MCDGAGQKEVSKAAVVVVLGPKQSSFLWKCLAMEIQVQEPGSHVWNLGLCAHGVPEISKRDPFSSQSAWGGDTGQIFAFFLDCQSLGGAGQGGKHVREAQEEMGSFEPIRFLLPRGYQCN